MSGDYDAEIRKVSDLLYKYFLMFANKNTVADNSASDLRVLADRTVGYLSGHGLLDLPVEVKRPWTGTGQSVDLNHIRDLIRRARSTEEPYDAADQWGVIGSYVPDLLEEIRTRDDTIRSLRQELDEAGSRYEEMMRAEYDERS